MGTEQVCLLLCTSDLDLDLSSICVVGEIIVESANIGAKLERVSFGIVGEL